jgi:hypothetical protein
VNDDDLILYTVLDDQPQPPPKPVWQVIAAILFFALLCLLL